MLGDSISPAAPALGASKLINISKHKLNPPTSLHFHNKRDPLFHLPSNPIYI